MSDLGQKILAVLKEIVDAVESDEKLKSSQVFWPEDAGCSYHWNGYVLTQSDVDALRDGKNPMDVGPSWACFVFHHERTKDQQ